jgi:uncharacterized protein YbjT (DUF2867 family)
MSSKKIIAIVGATGTQGGSVARTFLSQSETWTVRCLTRNPSSTSAQHLSSLGAEVVTASLDDVDSLKKAFAGAHIIFVNTDFWAPFRQLLPEKGHAVARIMAMETETRHANNAAEAARGVERLERYIYSALGPMKRASNGKYPDSHHWETKAAAVYYIETQLPDLAAKTSFIYIAAYATNAFLLPKPNPTTGAYELLINCPASTRFPIIETGASTGPFVHALISEPPRTKLLAYDDYLTITEVAETWKRVTGKNAEVVSLDMDEMSERTGLTSEVLCGPAFIGEFGYMGGIDGWIGPDQLRNHPETQSYEEYLRKQDPASLSNVEFEMA